MNMFFIVPGYHMPSDIHTDTYYQKYFDEVCSKIKEKSENLSGGNVYVILSGGNIDMDPPFNRVLSLEMKSGFQEYVKKYGLSLVVLTEENSISSVENLVESKKIIDEYSGINRVYVSTDEQRVDRNRKIAEVVFGQCEMLAVDLSHDLEKENKGVVEEKEKLALKISLWALQNKENYDKLHELYQQKYEYLRQFPDELRKQKEIEWWKEKLTDNPNLLNRN